MPSLNGTLRFINGCLFDTVVSHFVAGNEDECRIPEELNFRTLIKYSESLNAEQVRVSAWIFHAIKKYVIEPNQSVYISSGWFCFPSYGSKFYANPNVGFFEHYPDLFVSYKRYSRSELIIDATLEELSVLPSLSQEISICVTNRHAHDVLIIEEGDPVIRLDWDISDTHIVRLLHEPAALNNYINNSRGMLQAYEELGLSEDEF